MDIFKETKTGLEIALDNMSKASLKNIASNVISNKNYYSLGLSGSFIQ